ncbi:MAG: hypothetical protein WCC81_23070, partial [Pseudolabrys sp.]
RYPGPKPGMPRKNDPAKKQQYHGNNVGDAQRRLRIFKDEKGNHDREGGQNNKDANAQRTQPIAPRQSGTRFGIRQPAKSFLDQLELGRLENRRNQRRERICNDAVGAFRINRPPHFPQQQGIAASLRKTSHKIHPGINDSPGDIAAECRNQHGLDLRSVRRDNARCARDCKGHDQAKENFRYPFGWPEDPIRKFH